VAVALAVLVAHQTLLSEGGLGRFVEEAPRTSFLAANKEGFVAMAGYLGLYLLAEALGRLLRSLMRQGRGLGAVIATGSVAALSWLLLLGVYFAPSGSAPAAPVHETPEGEVDWSVVVNDRAVLHALTSPAAVSRKSANVPFVLWIVALCTTQIALFLAFDMGSAWHECAITRGSPFAEPTRGEGDVARAADSVLVDGMNRNGLALFLISNVFTGVVNKAVDTIHTADVQAMAILALYATTIAFAAVALRNVPFALKFW
jgi:phosphatidylinositol glycan class W